MKLLITGASSQDSILLSEAYMGLPVRLIGLSHREVNGFRKSALLNNNNFELIENFDYSKSQFREILQQIQPDIVVNLASVSSVMQSFSNPELTEKVNYQFVVNLLEAAAGLNMHEMRIFQASSSEMFGNSQEELQSESTELKPISPYGEAKARAHEKCIEMREQGLNVSTGILFNHESEYRQEGFLTKKIAKFSAEYYLGRARFIELGNLDISRDWGSARDFVSAIIRILNHHKPDDFVIATGRTTTVLELFDFAQRALNLDLNPKTVIRRNELLIRPAEKHTSTGNFRKIKYILGWEPSESIEHVMSRMVEFEVKSQ